MTEATNLNLIYMPSLANKPYPETASHEHHEYELAKKRASFRVTFGRDGLICCSYVDASFLPGVKRLKVLSNWFMINCSLLL